MEDPPGVFAGVYHALLQAGLKQEERVSDESYHPLGQRRQVLQHAANNCGSAVNLRKLCDSHPLLVIPRPRRMQRCAIYTISPGLSWTSHLLLSTAQVGTFLNAHRYVITGGV